MATFRRCGKLDVTGLGTIMRQVNRMVAFIELEGSEKADAIMNKTEEEYNLIVGNQVQNGRRVLIETYDKKMKNFQKEENIKEQHHRNESRMKIYMSREELLKLISDEIIERMIENAKNAEENRNILKNSIHQALLILVETNVILRVMERDKEDADAMLPDILKHFKDVTGMKCRCQIANKSLEKECIGGCILYNRRCTVKVSNTIRDRYTNVMEKVGFLLIREYIFSK